MGKKIYKFDKVLCKNFGKKIAYIRKEKGFTQDELAFKIGISTSYLSAIERGISDSTISTAKRVAKALEVDIYKLFIYDKK